MKGLLRKDLQLIWASWPILLMILVCGTGISIYIQQPTMEICFVTLLVFFGFGVAPGLLLSFYKKEAGPIAMIVAALLPVAILLVVMNTVSDTKIKEVFMILAAISMVLYFAIMVISPKIVTGWLNRNT